MFKTTKSRIIFVATFSAICIIITTVLVIYNNIDINQNESEENTSKSIKIEKDVQGIDTKGTYNQNSVKFEEKSYKSDKVESYYCKMSGLINKTIENKINTELEQIALNCYREKAKELKNIEKIRVYVTNRGNFANTVSFQIVYTIENTKTNYYYQEQIGLNYDLRTGKEIELKDLFTSDAPIRDILRKSLYNGLLLYNTEDKLNGEIIVKDYTDIEDDICQFIKKYESGEHIDFSYNAKMINVQYDKTKEFRIYMGEYPEYMAIYNRYLTKEDLYADNSIGFKNIYTLVNKYNDPLCHQIYQKEENYLIQINVSNYIGEDNDNEISKRLVNDRIEGIENEIKKLKEVAGQNKNSFYIMNYYITYFLQSNEEDENKIVVCEEYGNTYEMTKHDYEETVEPIIIENLRSNEPDLMSIELFDLKEVLNKEMEHVTEYYNLITGEKVVP